MPPAPPISARPPDGTLSNTKQIIISCVAPTVGRNALRECPVVTEISARLAVGRTATEIASHFMEYDMHTY
jgi:hypothetical protein